MAAHRTLTVGLCLVGVALHAGCGGDDDPAGPDAARADAALDAARLDAGSPDAGRDAGPDAARPPDAGPRDAGGTDTGGDGGPVSIADLCFSEIGGTSGPDYDRFMPTVGAHCFGTNHQNIAGVQEVVFLGDSVTVGAPNLAHPLASDNSHFYRNLLAEWLGARYGLSRGGFLDWGLWKSYDAFSGRGARQTAGDFRNCSKWGARTDDFLEGGNQIGLCFPSGGSPRTTLVIFTMGGNDISNITQYGADTGDVAGAWDRARSAVMHLDNAIRWLKDPVHFPGGSFVLFGNPFEFTDGTGNVDSCPAAGLAGFSDWADPTELERIVIFILEEYMRIAVETGSDLVWMLEHFCGHGYVATGASADTTNRCYRGFGTPRWFDETCIHPNDAGHRSLFDMFSAVVAE